MSSVLQLCTHSGHGVQMLCLSTIAPVAAVQQGLQRNTSERAALARPAGHTQPYLIAYDVQHLMGLLQLGAVAAH